MQAQLASTQAGLDRWQSTFAPVAQDASIPLEPEAILAELRQKREAQPSAAAAGPVSSASGDLLAARQREESLQVSVWGVQVLGRGTGTQHARLQLPAGSIRYKDRAAGAGPARECVVQDSLVCQQAVQMCS